VKSKLIYSNILVGTAILTLPRAAEAGLCALCRRALEQSGNGGLLQGFYWSIILIAGVPILIFLIAGLVYWRVMRNAKRLPGSV
jgi:hypothetical protein